MTEYEIADLAISNQAYIIDMAASFQEQIASRDALTQQFMTVLFAYLAAAYFIGATLSRKQAWIFSVLYFVWQAWTIIMHSVRGVGVRITMEKLKELVDFGAQGTALSDIMPQIISITQFTLLTAALAASLYFMWDVRHKKTE
jgi:hypothetical protein